jgi:hypothetical protein
MEIRKWRLEKGKRKLETRRFELGTKRIRADCEYSFCRVQSRRYVPMSVVAGDFYDFLRLLRLALLRIASPASGRYVAFTASVEWGGFAAELGRGI